VEAAGLDAGLLLTGRNYLSTSPSTYFEPPKADDGGKRLPTAGTA
jgi:hypothetical protein